MKKLKVKEGRKSKKGIKAASRQRIKEGRKK